MDLKWILSACLFIRSITCCDSEEMKTQPGGDVLLQCHSPVGDDIKLVRWIRPDLKSEGYVFFFRDRRTYGDNQHPSFHGRVELNDPQMKNGDVSVSLKNVNIQDTGTYECYVGYGGKPQLISTITLTVTDSGCTRHEEDNDEEDKEARVQWVIPAAIAVLALVFSVWVLKKFPADRPLVFRPI